MYIVTISREVDKNVATQYEEVAVIKVMDFDDVIALTDFAEGNDYEVYHEYKPEILSKKEAK